jgi:tachykinin-like receptor
MRLEFASANQPCKIFTMIYGWVWDLKKVVRMFMVIVTLFVVCWLPYHGYFVYQFIDDQVISYKYTQHIFLSFYWLAMSNTMINPLVYYYMNTR